MAYFQISTNSKGVMVARVQISGKDPQTGKQKLYVKRFYNEDNLSEAKFRKQLKLLSSEMEMEIELANKNKEAFRARILTFSELMAEWKESIKQNHSINYYLRACAVEKKFNAFLQKLNLHKKPISEITVRDVQLFLNSFTQYRQNGELVRLKKDLPPTVSKRKLAEKNVINRCTSYNLCRKGTNVNIKTAKRICEQCQLDMDEYFEPAENEKPYAKETIKGYRRILRTLFNEAIRYNWITRNPASSTKVGGGNSNISLRPVSEKEVFTFTEAKKFIKALDFLEQDQISKKMALKTMLLTGVRAGEMLGLRWSDVDLDKKVICIRRNRMYAPELGVYEKSPKTRTSVREIPIPDSLVQDFEHYSEWFKAIDENFESKLDEYYIVVNIYRQPLSPGRLGAWLSDFEKENGFKHVSCHGLRHTYCSLLLSQNVPIQTVAKYMGHSDSTITLQVYSHYIPDTKEKVISVLKDLD